MKIRLLMIIAIIVVGVSSMSHLNPSAQKSIQTLTQPLSDILAWFGDAFNGRNNDTKDTAPVDGTRVYKWQDSNGNWQFSSEPPPQGIASSMTVYRSEANVVQAQKPPPPAPEPESPTNTEVPTGPAPLLPITNPQRVKQLMDDAKNIQNLMDQRQQTIEQGANGR